MSIVKRRRLSAKTTNPTGYPEAAAAVSSQARPNEPKLQSQESEIRHQQGSLLKALQSAPRVGRVVLERGELFEQLQQMFPEHQVREIELCKGTDRLRKPPARLVPQEAPWRLSIGLHRHQMQPVNLGPWMQWQNLSNRQLCSKSPPLRLLVTVFAQRKDEAVELHKAQCVQCAGVRKSENPNRGHEVSP